MESQPIPINQHDRGRTLTKQVADHIYSQLWAAIKKWLSKPDEKSEAEVRERIKEALRAEGMPEERLDLAAGAVLHIAQNNAEEIKKLKALK